MLSIELIEFVHVELEVLVLVEGIEDGTHLLLWDLHPELLEAGVHLAD